MTEPDEDVLRDLLRLPIPISEDVWLALHYPKGWTGTEGSRTIMGATGVFAAALTTLAAKDRAYGGAWRKQGWMGNLARILSKSARLKEILWRADPYDDASEPVQDTLQDMINLCVFMILNLKDRNEWGRNAGE